MKFFVVSDIHSFYSIFIDALAKAGYDENNPNHWLIVCGDLFDRGPESKEVYKYFQNKERCTLIRGNHEDLILDCIERGYYQSHDINNGTIRTIMSLGNRDEFCDESWMPTDLGEYEKAATITYGKVKPLFDGMVNYFETKNYIFVHSWIPCKYEVIQKDVEKLGNFAYMSPTRQYKEDWRCATPYEWDEARWENPFKLANQDLNKTGKIIIFGHWHTSCFHSEISGVPQFCKDSCFDIAYDFKHNVIGIDGCTAYSNQCNILIVDDEFLEVENE